MHICVHASMHGCEHVCVYIIVMCACVFMHICVNMYNSNIIINSMHGLYNL